MTRRVIELAMVLWILLAASSPSLAAPLYRVTVVGPDNSAAVDINRSGQMVGNLQDGGAATRAFFFDGNVVHDLGTLPGGTTSTGAALNDSGSVVGTSAGDRYNHGFLYTNGVLSDISRAPESMAAGINNAGVAVGMALIPNIYDPDGSPANHAVTFFNGGSVDLTSSIGFASMQSQANDINEAGHLVGTVFDDYFPGLESAFVYRDGITQYIVTDDSWYGEAFAMNNHDQAVGVMYGTTQEGLADHTRMHAFIHESDTRKIDALRDGGNSAAWGINDAGHIVGWTETVDGSGAFLYVDGEMDLLDTLIDPASGWHIQAARSINAFDQIAATACRAGICQAVRLDPLAAIPEPAQWGLWGAGVMLLIGRRAIRTTSGQGMPSCSAAAREVSRVQAQANETIPARDGNRCWQTCLKRRLKVAPATGHQQFSAIQSGIGYPGYPRHSCHLPPYWWRN